MHVWTNRPYEAMWDYLDFFSQPANVKRLLRGEIESKRPTSCIDETIVERKSTQVAYSIRQGHEYFKAADVVSIATSPLLYYYGVLSLTKALLVANENSIFLEDLNYHGLTGRHQTDSPKGSTLEEEHASIKDGTFKSLVKHVHNLDLPNNVTFKYVDLLSIEPEISDMFRRYYHIPPKTYYLYHIDEKNDPYSLTICPGTKNFEGFEAAFPVITTDFRRSDQLKHNVALEYVSKPDRVRSFPDYMGIYDSMAGGRYLVGELRSENGPIAFNKYLAPEIYDFVNLFMLSNCVRYKQEFWNKLIEGNNEGSLGIIVLYLSVSKNRFPNYVLSRLFGERFTFGAAARLA